MAIRQLLADLGAQFERSTGVKVAVESVGGVDAAKRVQADEAFDGVVLSANAIDSLIAAGKVAADSRVDLAHSGVAVAVRAGAPRPDISSEDAVRYAVLSARSVGYSTGPSGVQLLKLFDRWGVMDRLEGHLVQASPGVSVGSMVADGQVELGLQQLSELMNLPGADVLGPLPPDIQIVTTFTAGRAVTCNQPEAARAFLCFLASVAANEAKRRNGMEPA